MTMTNSTQTTKPNFQAQFEEQPIEHSGKWRNVYFRRSGGVIQSNLLHESITTAQGYAQWWQASCIELMNAEKSHEIIDPHGNTAKRNDFPMTVIQIPVKE